MKDRMKDRSEKPLRDGRTCMWPIGDPSTSDFHFCGASRNSGGSYCAEHVQLAYQKQTNRRSLKHSPAMAARSTSRTR